MIPDTRGNESKRKDKISVRIQLENYHSHDLCLRFSLFLLVIILRHQTPLLAKKKKKFSKDRANAKVADSNERE